MTPQPLTNVILSISKPVEPDKRGPRRATSSGCSWRRPGRSSSNRYGKFSITKDDLGQMFQNFNEVTPKAPTELPIDYDHLSMDPKKPGDGIAAGWMKTLQLREDGDELWGEVEWTPDGAKRIANQEYRFVSPSFVKDHVHKDGKKIGTTLLGGGDHQPSLPGRHAGADALQLQRPRRSRVDARSRAAAAISLAEIGQRVMIAPGNARTQDEIGGTFEIAEVVGEGDDAFVSVKDAAGLVHKWFRMTELLPASTVPANPAHPALAAGPAAGHSCAVAARAGAAASAVDESGAAAAAKRRKPQRGAAVPDGCRDPPVAGAQPARSAPEAAIPRAGSRAAEAAGGGAGRRSGSTPCASGAKPEPLARRGGEAKAKDEDNEARDE